MPNSRTTATLFGRRLRLLRKARGWTLESLGRRASLGYKHVADIERGVKSPSFDAIDRLARALGVEPYELFMPSKKLSDDADQLFRDLMRDFTRFSSPKTKSALVTIFQAVSALQSSSLSRNREDQ